MVKVKGAPRNNTYIGRDATGKAVELGSATVIAELPASSIRIPSLWVPDKDPLVIQPKLLQTATEQKWRLIRRLRKRFPDPESLFATDSDSAMSNVAGITDPNGIHIFVDFSNIIIGFYNRLKASRHLHEKAYVSLILFFFPTSKVTLPRFVIANILYADQTTSVLLFFSSSYLGAWPSGSPATFGYIQEDEFISKYWSSGYAKPFHRSRNLRV